MFNLSQLMKRAEQILELQASGKTSVWIEDPKKLKRLEVILDSGRHQHFFENMASSIRPFLDQHSSEEEQCRVLVELLLNPHLVSDPPSSLREAVIDPTIMSDVVQDEDAQPVSETSEQRRDRIRRNADLEAMLNGSLDTLTTTERKIAGYLAALLVGEDQRDDLIESLVRTNQSAIKPYTLQQELDKAGVKVARKTITRALNKLRKSAMERDTNARNNSPAAALLRRVEELKPAYELLVAQGSDTDPALRRRTGGLLIHTGRDASRVAFAADHGVETICPGQSDDATTEEASNAVLDFLLAYMRDDLPLRPITDAAYVIADDALPHTQAVTALHAGHTLLGEQSFAANFGLMSIGLLGYDLLDADEYEHYFTMLRVNLDGIDAEDALAEADEFDLPSPTYARNACAFNIATKHHDEALAGDGDATHHLESAWSAITTFRPDESIEAGYDMLLAEHAGVALRVGRRDRAERAWELLDQLGLDADDVLETHATKQSEPALLDAARDAAETLGRVSAHR